MTFVCVDPKIRDLQNVTILLHRPADIAFVIEFFGFVTIFATRLIDNVQLESIYVNINGSKGIAIPLGNATYADDGCYSIEVVSATSTHTDGTVCLTVEG